MIAIRDTAWPLTDQGRDQPVARRAEHAVESFRGLRRRKRDTKSLSFRVTLLRHLESYLAYRLLLEQPAERPAEQFRSSAREAVRKV